MENVILVIHLILALVLIGLVLLQRSEGGGLGIGGGGGGMGSLATVGQTANALTRATAIAADIANRNPHAQRAAKRLFNRYLEVSADEILMAESVEQQALIGSKNQIEAVMSQMEKRKADFVDP